MKLTRFNQPLTFSDFLDDFFNTDVGQAKKYTIPAVNILNNEKDFTIELAVPGMDKNDLNVDVTNNVLTISAEQKEEKKEENDNFTCQEFCYSSFSRSFSLTEDVEQDKINAKYEDGILRVVLPKKEAVLTKGNKKIKIS
ncbi:MAG: Hsp20/alpha crystallin family protein [Bacteroidales bacterium]|jgi:HSP20 family protein